MNADLLETLRRVELLSVSDPDGSDCRLWSGAVFKDGYGAIWADGRTRLVHRVVYEAAHGSIPPRKCEIHTCLNRLCTRPDHLVVGSKLAVSCAKVARGSQAKGVGHGAAKLDDSKVREIRKLIAAEESYRSIAARYGVKYWAISQIAQGKTWKHVTP